MTYELEYIINWVIKAGTEPCPTCSLEVCEAPGKCFSCGGSETQIFTSTSGGLILTPVALCISCGGTGICPICNGALAVVPEEYSQYVVSSVLGSVIVAAVMMRDDNRFSDMNFLLDAANSWMARGRRMETPEQVEKLLDTFGLVDTAYPAEVQNGTTNVLSESELRELGLLDEEPT